MDKLRSVMTRRTIGGAVAGLALAFGLVAGVSAQATVDDDGVPVATSGDVTVTIVDGQAVIITGEEGGDDDLVVGEVTETELDDSSGLSVADASGGEFNVGVTNGNDG